MMTQSNGNMDDMIRGLKLEERIKEVHKVITEQHTLNSISFDAWYTDEDFVLRKLLRLGHEFSVNGFRKYFKTTAEQSGMLPINVEILMGHSVGLSDSYYRPTEQSLREDYLKTVDKLMVSCCRES
jgi:hypothetical protein